MVSEYSQAIGRAAMTASALSQAGERIPFYNNASNTLMQEALSYDFEGNARKNQIRSLSRAVAAASALEQMQKSSRKHSGIAVIDGKQVSWASLRADEMQAKIDKRKQSWRNFANWLVGYKPEAKAA